MNIGNIPTRNAIQYPDKTALIFEGERWTWRQFNSRINRLSQALLHAGVVQEGLVYRILLHPGRVFV